MQSAATAQSTMDFSTMAVDDGVVNSPISNCPVHEVVQSPSLVWPHSICHAISPIRNRSSRIERVLYHEQLEVPEDQYLKVS